MATDEVRSPRQDLADAIGTLRSLRTTQNMHPNLDVMVDWLEAEMVFAMDPTSRIIQLERRRRVQPYDPR